jgi:hypothetical protein
MAKTIETLSGDASYRLPATFSREIGRIIVHWAFFEHCVQEMIWDILKVSEAAGRIAVREPRVTDRLDMLRDILKLNGGIWKDDLFKSVRAKADLLASKRHLLGHGKWFHHKTDNSWNVELTRGSWPKDAAELAAQSRKVSPESIVITLAELRATTTEILKLFDDLNALKISTMRRVPVPSPKTPPSGSLQ